MTDQALYDRARHAGLAVDWTDAHGRQQSVSPDTLREVLKALGDFEPPRDGATADAHCYAVQDAAPGKKLAAIAVQLYSLRDTGGFGDLRALKNFTREAGAHGIDAIAVSPIHAPFLAADHDPSPYAPSSRLFLNPLYADTGPAPDTGGDLVDWPTATKSKMKALRAAFDAAGCPRLEADDRLRDHARFEALDAHFHQRGLNSFRDWPMPYRDARNPLVESFAREHHEDIAFHIFVQARAKESLAAAQAVARDGGMAIGLIADLAVGMSPVGSHAWSAPQDVLCGLTIGAPPDVFQPGGQNWGITALTPGKGAAAYAETLACAMRCAGGVRIDHAMGLQRLWVIPEGAGAKDGVYLYYPVHDMLSIVSEQSRQHRAIVIGEDLGTVDPHFREAMHARGMLGMEVLWFQRDGKRFLEPERWSPCGAGLSTTHDLPTVAGWWSGRDIDWLEKLGRHAEHGDIAAERRARDEDRAHLWSEIGDGPLPAPQDHARVVEAALNFVARTASPLAVVPAEDILGLAEQPNIPGTIDEHPNWRRRLPTGDVFARGAVNVAALLRGRRGA